MSPSCLQIELSALTTLLLTPVYYLTPGMNCSGDPPVLDPYDAKSGRGCGESTPQHCAVGDLWHKHGKMEGPNYDTQCVRRTENVGASTSGLTIRTRQIRRPIPFHRQRRTSLPRGLQRCYPVEQQDEPGLYSLRFEWWLFVFVGQCARQPTCCR